MSKNQRKNIKQKGFSIIEILLAAAIFLIFAIGITDVVIHSFFGNRAGEEQTIATDYATEGLEAARSIKNQAYSNLINSTGSGVASVSGVWAFSGANNVFGKYTRILNIGDVYRDGSGNIVSTGGTLDSDTKKITSTVSWNFSAGRANSVILSTYLTNYKKTIAKGGMLVYGDGGTLTDAIKFQVFDGTTWSTAASTADIDPATTNKYLRAVRLYNAPARTEKVIISRHYDGTTQYIYAQVWNGTSWGNVQLLSSWASNQFLNVQNFDGTYLANGSFMVVYSDNTVIPKMRIWNGSAWSAQSSLTSLGGGPDIPTYMVVSARPGTNEVMAAILDQAKHANTQYYNGSAWSAITTHSTNDFNNPYNDIGFAWSINTPTIGGIAYITSGGDKNVKIKLFQADGLGSGTWGPQTQAAAQANPIIMLSIDSASKSDHFQVCTVDSQAPSNITCQKAAFTGTTVTWSNPINNIITAGTATNPLQLTYDAGYENASGDPAIIVYSDTTATPKFKKYAVSTNTWDSAASNISTISAVMQSARIIPQTGINDMMILIGDGSASPRVYSQIWNGTNNVMYATPSGKALLTHGINGSNLTDYWYDFAWDN